MLLKYTEEQKGFQAMPWILMFAFLILSSQEVFAAEKRIRQILADGFDYPVGKPNGARYYKARGFWPNGHLGEDWNGVNGGNSDMGDPIYSIGHGVVVYSNDYKLGWGNVVIIRHAFRGKSGKIEMVDSLYGHLKRRDVKLYQKVRKGQLIGTMGNNRGMYWAHLHFEIRKELRLGMARSKFKRDLSCYYDPTPFINARRRLASGTKLYFINVDTFTYTNNTGEGVPIPKVFRGTKLRLPVPSSSRSASSYDRSSQPARKLNPTIKKIIDSNKPKTKEKEKKSGFWSRFRDKFKGGKVTPSPGPPAR